jgi:hypothetical protein
LIATKKLIKLNILKSQFIYKIILKKMKSLKSILVKTQKSALLIRRLDGMNFVLDLVVLPHGLSERKKKKRLIELIKKKEKAITNN